MAKGCVCVFNQTRQSFLSYRITVADTHLRRMVGMLGRRKSNGGEGLLVVPSKGIHTIGMLFPIDVVYLDEECRVIHLIEHLAPFSVTPIRRNCDSVLQLPIRSIYQSRTQVEDHLIIRSVSRMQELWSVDANSRREETTA